MQRFNNDRKIITSFVIVSFLVLLLGLFSVFKILELSNLTKKLYDHPLIVTNATQHIQTNLTSMHRYMKDVVLAQNQEELQVSLEKVNSIEKIIYNDFDIVFDKYLGDKKEIQTSYDLFVNWKIIRDEVVELMYKNNMAEAIDITKEKGAKHVKKLNESVNTLVLYARNKAELFVENANNTKKSSILITIIAVIIIIILISTIMIILLKSIKKSERLKYKQEQQMLQKSRLAQMGEMIENIAHQWRQPLSVISSSSGNLRIKKALGTLTDEKLDESLKAIEDTTQYLSQTIDTFRDFIKEKKEFKKVILQERIDRVLNIVNTSLKVNHIKLINKIDYSNPIKLTLVVGELSEVIISIINNAKDILVENNVKDAWIKLDLHRQDDKVIISIEDNGGGIPEDILSKIFDPYFTTKHQSQGTGLGLHLSYKIVVESLKGKLYAKNSENIDQDGKTSSGAKFFIELPLSQ